MLNPIQIREAFHLFVLRDVAPVFGQALRLKGGVNLRLFYGSERYSEDMDLDANARLRRRLTRLLPEKIDSPSFRRELLALGIRNVAVYRPPAKDTETALRYKVALVAGAVPYPTKIEISYRGEASADWSVLGRPLGEVTGPYLAAHVAFPELSHYGRPGAVWQKVFALANRAAAQARDVFDLGVLLEPRLDDRYGRVDVSFLRAHLTDDILREAAQRAVAVTPQEFRDQVAAFLAPEAQLRQTDAWETTQLTVATFIEDVSRHPTAPGHKPRVPRRRTQQPRRDR